MEKEQNKLPRILFVDDEAGVLNAMNRLFHDESYEILTATGGLSALELLQNTGPVQLVISDYRMPVMNGVEFIQRVMQRWPDTRRVILSGFPDSDVLLAALNEGRVHRFLVKPWDNDALKTVVKELLDEFEMLVSFRQSVEELARNNRLLSRTNEHLSAVLTDVLANMRRDAVCENVPRHTCYNDRLHESLSPRDHEILLAIASGHSLKAIAMNLELSIKTVSTYKKRLIDKMGFKNDVDLIGYTLKNNLLHYPTL
jgi:DNA-binding NarL/FixJ family response regulator